MPKTIGGTNEVCRSRRKGVLFITGHTASLTLTTLNPGVNTVEVWFREWKGAVLVRTRADGVVGSEAVVLQSGALI